MSQIDQIRDAIAARLALVPNIGRVHTFERYAKDHPAFRPMFVTESGQMLGWTIRRVRTEERVVDSLTHAVVDRWRIVAVMGLEDAQESELAFDAMIETVRDQFRLDETLGGVVDTTTVDDLAGLQLEDSGPAMFAGILCHSARLSLSTQYDIGHNVTVADDFVTGNVKWDLGPVPDEAIDAEDTLNLEQEE